VSLVESLSAVELLRKMTARVARFIPCVVVMLSLVGVSKSYGGVVALHPTDLAVPPGKTTVLLGPSGCGKSTLLRLMVGLVLPDRGQVLFKGRPMTPRSARELRRQIGFVVQDGGLFPHLTARGNVLLMARYLGWEPKRSDARLAELVDLTRFPADRLDRYPAEMSGGQRQRVSLMRALMLDPELLLLDEPLGALDPLIRSELQADLRDIFRRLGKTVVLVTHDLGEAGFLGDHLVLLRAGQIEQQAPFDTLVQQPATPFVRQFITAQRSLHTLEEVRP
jgi:osmoprotectant transport system ATP-binding protein